MSGKPDSPVLTISEIKIGRRYRSNLGDLDALAVSISEIGLLHPVVVDRKAKLIAGRRRIEACKQLGWTRIPVHTVNLEALVEPLERKEAKGTAEGSRKEIWTREENNSFSQVG